MSSSVLISEIQELLLAYEQFKEAEPQGNLSAFAAWVLNTQHNSAFPTDVKDYIHTQAHQHVPEHEQEISDRAMLSYFIARLYLLIRSYVRDAFRGLDIHSIEEFSMLSLVYRIPGASKSALKEASLLEFSTLSHILLRLRQAGLIREHLHAQDKRVFKVFITPKGRATLIKAYKRLSAIHPPVEGNFNPEEKLTLMYMLNRLHDFHVRAHAQASSEKKRP